MLLLCLSSSESGLFLMYRLPVLAGAAGALGATYCSPYIAVDGAYHPRPSGKTSSSGDSRLVAFASSVC